MKKLFFFLFVLTQFTSLSAQQCNAGGCGFGGSQYPGGTFSNPGAAFVTVSTLIYGGEYQLYNVTSGNYYEWTYCSADGANGVEDMQLTLFNNANGTQLCYSDDICDGNRPKIGWTANFTGTVRVLTSLYYCTTNTTSHTLRWREVCVGPAFPGFGSNSWNVAVWNAGDAAGNSGAWSSNYAGYYNIPSLSFDTRQGVTYSTAQSWDPNGTPSSASGYVGCPVGADNHSYAFRRQGFPCAIYQINIPTHDDESHLYINGVLVWEHDNGCCDAHTNVWTGVLGPNTQIDYYVSEGGGGSHGSLEILNVGALAINSSNASMYTCDAARALTVNNSNPAGGVWSGTGVSGASFNPASAGVGGPHTITYSNQGCSATQGISVVSNGNPATFGANTWNVYGYNGNDVNLGGGVSYRGFYTEPLLSYQSINRWCNTCAPSDASGWAGCAVGIDNHTVVSKRTGVPSNGVYSVSVNLHDDNFQLYTGGVNKFESGYCCMVHTDVLTEYMDGATSMELRHGEGVGGSGQGLLFTQQNLSATISKTDKTACTTNNGTITFSNPTGAVAAPVFRSNFSAATGVTVSGSASVTGGILQLTPNAGSQLGGAIFTNSTATNASSFRAEFDFRVFDGSEADGFSFNYGNMAGPPANAGEGGWGTGLCVNFVTYPGAGGPFVRVLYGGANISGNIGVAIRNAAYRKCVIFVNASNQLSVSINGVAVITNLGLPAGFASTDKTAWQFSMSGRTGGATDNHWIDNLVINAYNQYEYSLDGTSWTSNPAFTGLATGTYTPRLRNKAFPTYPVSLANVTIANPSSPTATVGVTNVTCNGGSNGVVSANATGAAAPYSYAWSGGGTSAIKTTVLPEHTRLQLLLLRVVLLLPPARLPNLLPLGYPLPSPMLLALGYAMGQSTCR
jgi:hypothetical protein